MKAKCIIVLVTLFLIGLLGINAYAEADRFALTAKAGTLGLGLEGITFVNSKLNARVGVNAFQYDYSGTESDIKYDFDLNLLTFSALVDWLPFNNGFRLTGGLMVNKNSLDLSAETAGTYKIGDTTYTSAQVGSLTGDLIFNDLAPYVGIGWGNPFGKDSNWSFSVDLGVMFQGSPDVSLSANGTLSSNAVFLDELAREEDRLESETDNFEFYPVISFGVTYKF
jgi:hypothetical protein